MTDKEYKDYLDEYIEDNYDKEMLDNHSEYCKISDLAKRFIEIDKEYDHSDWNLTQILANIRMTECYSIDKGLIKWLPYPEYKPSNGSPVLVTYNWKGLIFDEDDFEVCIGEYWDNGGGFGKYDKYIIAFAALPQPYKTEENKH